MKVNQQNGEGKQYSQNLIQSEVKRQQTPTQFIVLSLLMSVTLFSVLIATCLTRGVPQNYDGEPSKLRIVAPPSGIFNLELGNSRVIQILFYSGFDDRNDYFYKTVTKRNVIISLQPKGIIDIDIYGRIETLTIGKTILKIQSQSSPQIMDEITINVIPKSNQMYFNNTKKIVNYTGKPAQQNKVLQKIVNKLSKQQALQSECIPLSIKQYISKQGVARKQKIIDGSVIWEIVKYADGSNRTYIKRTDNNDDVHIRDKIMHLMGDRYLPGDGSNVESIQIENNTLWVVNNNKSISKIQFIDIDYKQKAEMMVQNTQRDVMRYGLASGASYNGQTISRKSITDNDALWTGLYGAGELMRYATLKQLKYSSHQIQKAKQSALLSLKAVLMISNIPLRNKTIDSTIRYIKNKIDGESGIFLSKQCLKKDKFYALDNYVGSAVDGSGFFGIDAGQYLNRQHFGGSFKYSYQPLVSDDWSQQSCKQNAATTKRSLDGFVSRTFLIQKLDGTMGGLIFRHNKNDTQTVISGAEVLYDFDKSENPILDLGKKQLPDILKQYLNINGTQYNKQDIIYKGDTSTDSIIAHIFIYKIAYDILDQNDDQERALRELISSTMITFCTSWINNGYNLVDATGHGTKWGKITRDFIISDSTLEDAPLKAFQLLLVFKLCYYITGETKWHDEYEMLIKDPSYKYLDVVASLWSRWKYRTFNQDPSPQNNIFKNYSQTEIQHHIIYGIHYSDEQQAFLAFYLAFQMEDNPQYLAKYRQAIQGWWHSVSKSQNPLWYYIYQLAYPNQIKKDKYNRQILSSSSLALSKHNVDTKKSQAFIEGSRNDIALQNLQSSTLSFDPTNNQLKDMFNPQSQQKCPCSKHIYILSIMIFFNRIIYLFYESQLIPPLQLQ